MEIKLINPVTRFLLTQFLCSTLCLSASQELLKGFTVAPDPSVSTFQPILTDSSGNYSVGLLRVNKAELALSIIHIPSSEPLWTANTTRRARWADQTRVFFNGSLVISDPRTGVFWSTGTDGDRVWLSNSSNLLVQKFDRLNSSLWQSFDFPTDTLVENQNFTSSMALVSSNGLYSLRLGDDFWGLYANFGQGTGSKPGAGQIFWKHRALQAKAEIVEGQGPIHLVLNPDGFLGMYQNGSVPVDVEAFRSFNRPDQSGIRRVRIETDGNLKGYYWTGSSWVLDYQAISESCQLPSACGPYGLCHPGKGCSCIDNRTAFNSGRCVPPGRNSGDFCGIENSKYEVLRGNGIDLPYKELMGYERMGSWAQCEDACGKDCGCWGAVYRNSSGFCYRVEYPIQTMVSNGDGSTIGYFKVREGAGKKGMRVGFGVGIGLLCGAILTIGALLVVGWYKVRRRKRGLTGFSEEEGGLSAGPYKDLGSASFRSLELIEKK